MRSAFENRRLPYLLLLPSLVILAIFLFYPANGYLIYFSETLLGVRPGWLTNGTLALIVVTMAATWKTLGYNNIFYLTGLQNVRREALEAASIDGADAAESFILFTLVVGLTLIQFRTTGKRVHYR